MSPSNRDAAALRLHAPDADPHDWQAASDEDLLAALNRSDLPYPNLDFIRWAKAHRPDLAASARMALQTLGVWDDEANGLDDETREALA